MNVFAYQMEFPLQSKLFCSSVIWVPLEWRWFKWQHQKTVYEKSKTISCCDNCSLRSFIRLTFFLDEITVNELTCLLFYDFICVWLSIHILVHGTDVVLKQNTHWTWTSIRRKVEFPLHSTSSRKNMGPGIRTPGSNSNTYWFGEIGQIIVNGNHNITDLML